MSSITYSKKIMSIFEKHAIPMFPSNTSGPNVILRVVQRAEGVQDEEVNALARGSVHVDYTVSEALLHEKSPYFTAMFKDQGFQESFARSEVIELAGVPGVLSEHSVKMILCWLNDMPIVLDCFKSGQSAEISQMVELARLADYWLIEDIRLEIAIAETIQHIILHRPRVADSDTAAFNALNLHRMVTQPNTRAFTLEHVNDIFELPSDHQLQKLCISAAMESYILEYSHDHFIEMLLQFKGVENALSRCALATLKSSLVVEKEASSSLVGRITSSILGMSSTGDEDEDGAVFFRDPFSGLLFPFPAISARTQTINFEKRMISEHL